MLFKHSADRRTFHDRRAHLRPEEQSRYYNSLLRHYYTFFIPPEQRVLEVGCGVGDLLAALRPLKAVGIDFSMEAIRIARERHPELEFYVGDVENFREIEQKQTKVTKENDFSFFSRVYVNREVFDYIILSDLVNDLYDVQGVLESLRAFAHPRTRLVVNFFSNLWRPILKIAEGMGCKAPNPPQNWLSSDDMRNLLSLAGWEVLTEEHKIICPAGSNLISRFLNRVLAPLFPSFCLTIFQTARLAPVASNKEFTCSVVIPARNEEGNIEAAVRRVPLMGAGTEIIFIEGHSKDGTWPEINRVAEAHPERRIKVLKQKSKGKGGAVREAFEVATGDIVMILDADLTMPPEELPKYYEALRSGRAEFVNGVRLVYPMEDEAMQFLNMVANKCFGLAFSWLLGQHVKDTLCGTKVLFRRDYQEIARNRSYFGEFDPFGDFDLLFGAARLNLKIVDMPIRYQRRSYGETNIQRWQHGALLARMLAFAAARLKFV